MAQLDPVSGVLDVTEKGFGFLRSLDRAYAIDPEDTYVGQNIIRKYKLRTGMFVEGKGAKKSNKQANLAIEVVEKIDGISPENSMKRQPFNRLTVIDPIDKYTLETGPLPLTTRIIDLFAPIGRGQRALMVSPPKAGKTTFLEDIALAVKTNYESVRVIVFLIDERPEEVTQFKRGVGGEIVATSFDAPLSEQIRVSELLLDRVCRLVEVGEDVVLIVDSLTRLGRAFNKASDGRGKTLSGGVSANALEFPRKFFGAARNIENGGSLTIVATCLVDTGSRMDEVIFQEFKGTGNTELVLDRELSDQRVFPAVNLRMTGTRKEEKLQTSDDLKKIWTIVRALANDKNFDKYRVMLEKLEKAGSNKKFLDSIPTV